MTLRNMVILFLATTKVFLHLLDNFLFVERGADMRVDPIELFRGSLASGMARWPRASPVSKLKLQNLLYGESACRFALRRRHSHTLWFLADVIGLFSNNVGPFSLNLVPRAFLFSNNVVPK